MKATRERLYAWWWQKKSVIAFSFCTSLSNFYFRFKLLGYGVKFSVELPYVLEKLNLINWLTKRCVLFTLKAVGSNFGAVSWHVGQHKWLELQLFHGVDLLSFNYYWTTHQDQWGHTVDATLAGIYFHLWFIDRRRWDDKNNRKETLHVEEPENLIPHS